MTDVYAPLYEGKMISFFDHRAADVVKSATAQHRQNQPRYLTDDEKDDPNRELRTAPSDFKTGQAS